MNQRKPKYLCPTCGVKAVVFTSKGAFWCIPTRGENKTKWGCGDNFNADDTRITGQMQGQGQQTASNAPNMPPPPPEPAYSPQTAYNPTAAPQHPVSEVATAPNNGNGKLIGDLTVDIIAEAVAQKVLKKLIPVIEKNLLPIQTPGDAPTAGQPAPDSAQTRCGRLKELMGHRLFDYVALKGRLKNNTDEICGNAEVLEKWIDYLEGTYKDAKMWEFYIEDLKKELKTVGQAQLGKKIIDTINAKKLRDAKQGAQLASALQYGIAYVRQLQDLRPADEKTNKVCNDLGLFGVFDLPWSAKTDELKRKGDEVLSALRG